MLESDRDHGQVAQREKLPGRPEFRAGQLQRRQVGCSIRGTGRGTPGPRRARKPRLRSFAELTAV